MLCLKDLATRNAQREARARWLGRPLRCDTIHGYSVVAAWLSRVAFVRVALRAGTPVWFIRSLLVVCFASGLFVVNGIRRRRCRRLVECLRGLARLPSISPTVLRLNPHNKVVDNFTRRPHLVVYGITCDGNGFAISGVGKYLGFVFAPGPFEMRWFAVLSRAAHVKSLGLHSCGVPLAYKAYYAIFVVIYTAQLLPLGGTTLPREHSHSAQFCGAHVCLDIATRVVALGPRYAPQDLRRLMWACRLRAVLRCAGLALAVQRADAAVFQGRCLAPRASDAMQLRTSTSCCSMRRASRRASRNTPSPRPRLCAAEARPAVLRTMVARRMARLLGEEVHQPQTDIILDRLSDFASRLLSHR